MNKEDSSTKDHYLKNFSVFVLFLLPLIFYQGRPSGDAAIYFQYFKNFFTLPFAFQPDTVAHGATSPLHVFLHATFFFEPIENWIIVGRLFNGLLLFSGIILLSKTYKHSSVFQITAFTLLCSTLITTAAQIYESALVFFSLSLVLFFIRTHRVKHGILWSSLLYLVRPELILVTGIVWIKVFSCHKEKRFSLLPYFAASLIPLILYTAFLVFHTGQIIPASVAARSLTALEQNDPWVTRFFESWSTLGNPFSIQNWFWLLFFLASFLLIKNKKFLDRSFEYVLIVILALPFLLSPPGPYLQRYLLPIIPACMGIITFAFPANRKYFLPFLLLILLCGIRYSPGADFRSGFDRLLLRDLHGQTGHIFKKNTRVLLYEIQGQLSSPAHFISLDGIVGGEILSVLKKEESLTDFLQREQIEYIITMNSFNYRKVFKNTLFEKLYLHEQSSSTGESFKWKEVRLTKLLENPEFTNTSFYKNYHIKKLNSGETVRVYQKQAGKWENHHLFWNSVYRIE